MTSKLVESEELAEALKSALQRDPDFILVIAPMRSDYYKGIGKVLYTSQRVGVPIENLRYMTEDGRVVTFDELRAITPAEPV
jgi:hypothetical protein